MKTKVINNATLHTGDEAVERFKACLNAYFQNDAIGKVYCVTRNEAVDGCLVLTPLSGCAIDGLASDLYKDESRLEKYEMVVIDSGNISGDSWKATFHPRQLVTAFVYEAS